MRVDLWDNEEYSYRAAYGFMPNIRSYIHDDDIMRNCILVVPGGGYCMVVSPEAEIVAKRFYDEGFNCFVLTYTTDITTSIPLKKQPMKDISRAIKHIRKNSEKYKIFSNRIFLCGFSAGAHLCGTICTHFNELEEKNEQYKNVSDRPDGAILSYPVITTGEKTHKSSVYALLGNNPSSEELEYFSVDKNVKIDTPPCFLWHTVEDDLVPVENSYFMAMALKNKNIPYAHYVFPNGNHGLSIASEEFFKGEFGEEYTFEQLERVIENLKNNTLIDVSEARVKELKEQFFVNNDQSKNEKEKNSQEKRLEIEKALDMYADVSSWPSLAIKWINKINN